MSDTAHIISTNNSSSINTPILFAVGYHGDIGSKGHEYNLIVYRTIQKHCTRIQKKNIKSILVSILTNVRDGYNYYDCNNYNIYVNKPEQKTFCVYVITNNAYPKNDAIKITKIIEKEISATSELSEHVIKNIINTILDQNILTDQE